MANEILRQRRELADCKAKLERFREECPACRGSGDCLVGLCPNCGGSGFVKSATPRPSPSATSGLADRLANCELHVSEGRFFHGNVLVKTDLLMEAINFIRSHQASVGEKK